MKFILTTERLSLRYFNPEKDAEAMYLLNSNPNVMRYTGDTPFASVDASYAFLCAYNDYEKYGFGRFAIDLNTTGETIGWCGLKYHERGNFVDLGYRLFEEHWNKGYATEASIASINCGFDALNLDEIVARTSALNTSSIRVIEKLGFTESFTFSKDQVCDRIFLLSKAVHHSNRL